MRLFCSESKRFICLYVEEPAVRTILSKGAISYNGRKDPGSAYSEFSG